MIAALENGTSFSDYTEITKILGYLQWICLVALIGSLVWSGAELAIHRRVEQVRAIIVICVCAAALGGLSSLVSAVL